MDIEYVDIFYKGKFAVYCLSFVNPEGVEWVGGIFSLASYKLHFIRWKSGATSSINISIDRVRKANLC